MNEFNVLQQPIGPGVKTLIEAGAGTGKTYNIENLYLRLLLEGPEADPAWQDTGVRNILVVTFTEAATAELVDRIRSNLATAVEMLEANVVDAGHFPGSIIAAWLERRPGAEPLARQRLKSALLAFDEAAIMTIHGFCARMLSEFTFESGIPFNTELLEDQSELLAEVIDDWWRQTIYPSTGLAALTSAAGITPESMTGLSRKLCSSPDLRVFSHSELRLDPAKDADNALFSLDPFWSPELVKEIAALPFRAEPGRAISMHLHYLQQWFEKRVISAGLPDAIHACAKDTLTADLKGKSPGFSPALQRFADACAAFAAEQKVLIVSLKNSLLTWLRDERALEKRKQELQVQSFDDLLLSMRQTLRGTSGARFAEVIRRRFRIALIDEFQDTDPVQYEIFTKIFSGPETMMLMVGDPKQSIYGFRGADIFAYLDVTAKLDDEEKPTLIRNFRSSAALLRAINAIFANHLPFADAQIGYHPAVAGAPSAKLLINGVDCDNAPLELWMLEAEKSLARGLAEKQIARATASRIAHILNQARIGEAFYRTGQEDIAVRASDIAVLTYKHSQAALMRRELTARGVNAVIQKSMSVFAAAEASELFHVLSAIVDPGNLTALRTALVTTLFNRPVSEVGEGFESDSWFGEFWLEKFGEYHRLWEKSGFIKMFRVMLNTVCDEAAQTSVRTNILSQPDGERKLTNMLHLAELLHHRSRNGMMGMAAILEWLRNQILEPDSDDEYEQRLESDEDAVKIMTVFKSKGLQFPIVFCPFVWERGFTGSKRAGYKPTDFVIHGQDDDGIWHPQLFLGDNPPMPCTLRYYQEQLSEVLRLFYVAVTRAKYLCVLGDGNIKQAGDSALRYLMTDGAQDHLNGHLLDPSDHIDIPRHWREAGIAVMPPCAGDDRFYPEAGNIHLSPLEWPEGKIIPRRSGVMSFSSLTEDTHAPQHLDPDRDDLEDAVITLPEIAVAPADIPLIAGFPRGAVSGDCVHQIFELLDFSRLSKPGWQTDPEITGLIEDKLSRFGYIPADRHAADYAEKHQLHMNQLLEMYGNVLRTPLQSGFRLCDLGKKDQVAEMDFFFKVARNIDSEAINQTMRRFGLLDYRQDFAKAVESASLNFKAGNGPRRGFMTGKIDLLYRHNGKYYILDWKTTFLGERYLDYRPATMLRSMIDASYILQYYIYTLAVDKYLRHRMPGYDYQQHFGGVYYLYVRGINGTTPDTGVFFDRPDAELIKQLYRIFPEE